jgi:hypothetical protein
MQAAIEQMENALAVVGKGSPWSVDLKVTDEFLDPLFNNFFRGLELPNLMRKTDYHTLALFVPRMLIDSEVKDVLDQILATCERAKPGMREL